MVDRSTGWFLSCCSILSIALCTLSLTRSHTVCSMLLSLSVVGVELVSVVGLTVGLMRR